MEWEKMRMSKVFFLNPPIVYYNLALGEFTLKLMYPLLNEMLNVSIGLFLSRHTCTTLTFQHRDECKISA